MIGRKSPLHDWHSSRNARFVEYGGWQIPEVYGKSMDPEYAALRNGVAMVDLCHEARYRVEGVDADSLLDDLLTIDVAGMETRQVKLAFMCNQRGGIIDQLMVYRDQSYFLLLGTAPARYAALEWLEQHAQIKIAAGADVRVVDVTTAQGQLHLAGPGAGTVLARIAGPEAVLEPGSAIVATIDNARCLVVRRITEGYDVVTGSVYTQPLWERIMETVESVAGRPVGNGAREIVRVESGHPLVGAEIDEDTTPIEIGHTAAVDFRKKRFEGRRALMHSISAEFTRQMAAFHVEMDRPLEVGCEVLADSMPIGRITSHAVSPIMRCRLGLGYISALKAKAGTVVALRNRDGATYKAELMRPGKLVIQR